MLLCACAPACAVPQAIKTQLVVMSCGAFLVTWHWERLLRHLFPAPVPHAKGYMAHMAELKRGGGGGGAKKRQ